MAKVEKQKERVSELLSLIAENPTLRIVPMVETDVVPSDDYSWWIAEFGIATIEEIYNDDERVYIRSKDEYELIEDLLSDINEDVDEDFAYKRVKEQVKNYEWEKVIAVRITV